MKLSVIFLVVKSHFSNRQFKKMSSWNHHSYGCILQGVPHIICYHGLHIRFPRWPTMVCVMENAAPHGYICFYNLSCRYHTFKLSTKHYRMFLKLLLISKEHMLLGTMISILDCQNGHLLWLILQIGNDLRYNRDFLYISVSKVQWCVDGHWIHMQRSYKVNILISLVCWFNPACSIYVKIS